VRQLLSPLPMSCWPPVPESVHTRIPGAFAGDCLAAWSDPVGAVWVRHTLLRVNLAGRKWCLRSAQPDQAADGQVSAQEQGDGGHELQGVAQQPVLAVFEQRLGGLRPELQER